MRKKILTENERSKGSIVIYRTAEGASAIEVNVDQDTVWLTQKQMSELFEKDVRTINEHIRNVFTDRELEENSVIRKFRITAADGKSYETLIYNLDVIISVGYRVKSQRGTQFRIWATQLLKEHLVKGYTINEKRLKEEQQKLCELQKTIALLEKTVNNQQIELIETKELIRIISDYAYALTILDQYDHQTIAVSKKRGRKSAIISYDECIAVIQGMKGEFSSALFGREKDDSFKGILGNIYQTFSGAELYPSIEEKAAHLLYFIVKDHSFTDGNKRIAAAIFIYFLAKNKSLFNTDGSKRIADNALVAITLMIAESKPEEKDIITKVVTNLINKK